MIEEKQKENGKFPQKSEHLILTPLAVPLEKRNSQKLLEFSCTTNCDTQEKNSSVTQKSKEQVKRNNDSFKPLNLVK